MEHDFGTDGRVDAVVDGYDGEDDRSLWAVTLADPGTDHDDEDNDSVVEVNIVASSIAEALDGVPGEFDHLAVFAAERVANIDVILSIDGIH